MSGTQLTGTVAYLEGEYGELFEKNQNFRKWLKDIWINSEFDADSKYDTSFKTNPLFLDENRLANSQKSVKIMEKPALWEP
jgi:hypothetical protein